ncbi:TM2 domain-containing protein [Acrasis kona]|uniref:TM2 domain-containing protein n=1 Tax=Acrasis kona TaxID=1008807 RepID=A0AAW2Z691_9EUKA
MIANQPAGVVVQQRFIHYKDTLTAYMFYLNDAIGGVIWFCTFGLFLFGWLIDICLIPGMVERENERLNNGNKTIIVNTQPIQQVHYVQQAPVSMPQPYYQPQVPAQPHYQPQISPPAAQQYVAPHHYAQQPYNPQAY